MGFSYRRFFLCHRTGAYGLHKTDPCTNTGGIRHRRRASGCAGTLYKPLIDLAGCGATVPLTGFGYLLYNGVREQIDKIGFLGIFTGGLTASAAGITAAMTFAFIFSLFFKSSAKE